MTADPQTLELPPRRSVRGRRAAAVIALVLGLAGFGASMTAVVIQLMPRHFTAGEQQQIKNWEISSRWQTMTAGQIFPATVGYQLPAQVLEDTSPLNLNALRVGIAAQSGCAAGATPAAAEVLRREGCKAVLRATYVDATRSYVLTVGVVVLPTGAAAAAANAGLRPARLTTAHQANGASQLAAGVQVVRFGGAAAGMYDYNRQIAGSSAYGPYLVMYAVGYADGRPRVPVIRDAYSYGAMTSLAQGVAQSVGLRLAAQPAPPHCPGAPGC